MSEITVNVESYSENLSKPGLRYVVQKVWALIKPYLAGLSLLLGALSALYISGVTNGSTGRALDIVEKTQQEDQKTVSEALERLARLEAEQKSIAALTPSVIKIASDQGELKGTVSSIDQNVHLLLDALLRGPREGSAPLQPAVPSQK